MKRLLFLLITPFLLSSCASTFLYSTISSLTEDVLQTEDGDFISENDSLLVAYWFNGQNLPIFINVYNKSELPLYVDWERSSIITDNDAVSYNGRVTSVSEIDGGVMTIEPLSFIPPMSRRTFQTRALSNFDYKNLKNLYFKKTSIPNNSGHATDIQLLEFSRKTTPLQFRSYLSFFTDNYDKPFSVEHEFYISSLIKTKQISPSSMPKDVIDRGDIFYIEKVSNNRYFGNAVLGTTLLVGLVVVDVALSSDEE